MVKHGRMVKKQRQKASGQHDRQKIQGQHHKYCNITSYSVPQSTGSRSQEQYKSGEPKAPELAYGLQCSITGSVEGSFY